jgi:hypothetical protein
VGGLISFLLIVRCSAADTPSMLSQNVSSTSHVPSQDTWHSDQQAFNEDQLQSLSTMLVGTSYCKPCGCSLHLANHLPDLQTHSPRFSVIYHSFAVHYGMNINCACYSIVVYRCILQFLSSKLQRDTFLASADLHPFDMHYRTRGFSSRNKVRRYFFDAF